MGKAAVATIAAGVVALALVWSASFWWQWLSLPWNSRMVIASAVPTFLLLAAIWWLWWQLPKRQAQKLDISDPKDRVDVEDDFRKTIGQILGGAAVLIGAAFAYLQFTDQQHAALAQLQASQNATQAQQQASHELLISNQVSRGFEQLASDKITERLGGIYALEGVMSSSDQYHQPVLEALCAFVRESTKPKAEVKSNKGPSGPPKVEAPATDVQAALTVIGRRKQGRGRVDLSEANIPGADLFEASLSDANLSSANLGSADLRVANLFGAHLSGANLGRADLYSADLRVADLTAADLSGANLNYAHLSHATLTRATLKGADLFNADLSGANLLDANLSDADLTGADLSDAHAPTQAQLDQACGKPNALPPGLHLDKSCRPRPATTP
jgi:uncharacterized protein YjbI with pentapeptide repeats